MKLNKICRSVYTIDLIIIWYIVHFFIIGAWLFSYAYCGMGGRCIPFLGALVFFLSALVIIPLQTLKDIKFGYIIIIHLLIDVFYILNITGNINSFFYISNITDSLLSFTFLAPFISHLFILIKTIIFNLKNIPK